MDNNFKLLKISQVSQILNISVSSLRNAVKNENWDYCPQPAPVKIGKRQSLRWYDYAVYAFANGDKTEYRTASKEKLPDEWSKYLT